MDNKQLYQNPLNTRYCSKEMQYIFSEENKFRLWRKLWIALAESEKELGLNITDEQINELKKYKDDINYCVAQQRETEVRHDVMSHVYAYGIQCPKASPIIHLGATSCYVTDNSELIMSFQALTHLEKKLKTVIFNLKEFALKYKSVPTLGFTHLQPAQLTTVGKRASLWLYDLYLDLKELQKYISTYKLRGIKGTTGTQASFMQLFNNDNGKVKKLESLILNKLGFKQAFAVTGQTYTRKFDYDLLSILSKIAQSAYKFSNDIRLLQSFKEIEEPFEKSQIGSSAMAYKRNPMRSERIGSLSRYLISLPINASITSSTQWLERTLDDSANRRIVIAQGFLTADAILNLYANVSENLVVYKNVINRRISEELPFMATEAILMEGVKAGGNRQDMHEKIRELSMIVAKQVKEEGKSNNLIELIKNDEAFANIKNIIDDLLSAENFIGRAPMQVEELIAEYIDPELKDFNIKDKSTAEISV